MIRAISLRCPALHDPISPIIVHPSIIGWEAKQLVRLTLRLRGLLRVMSCCAE